MKKFILLSIVLLSLMVAPLSEVFAQARLINYQGNILNQENLPYEGPVQITFELYSADFGGSQLWSEIQNVTLNKGYFNVYLGSVSPFPANFNFNRDLWLQVTVGKGSPYQRTMLSMVPYSGYSDRSAIAGFAEDIPDGSVTLIKLADEVINMGGDLTGQLPNPRLRPGAILEGIPDGSITQAMLNPNVTVRPSGPASGDLTGFYPDPQIAAGAVKTDRIADGAVINSKIADFTIKYNKLQNAIGPIGTILGWDGTKWIETNVPAWEIGRIKSIVAGDGNYVNNVTDAQGFITSTVGIANDGVTTAKIADDAVTYAKIQNAVGANGTILAWNGTNWVENTVPALEADAVIGNEVLNATPNLGLVRAGAGTAASPYTLGIAESGVVTNMIAMDAVTYDKIQNAMGAPGTILSWNGGHWVENNVPALEADGVIGNELLDATVGRGLVRAGAGTTANPYTIGIAEEGIVNSMIDWATIEYNRLQNAAGPIGTIIGWNGTDWIETNVSAWEKGKVMAVTAGAGTTVNNTTDGEGFISAEVGIANQGVTNAMLAPGAVSLDKLAAGNQIGQIMWWDNAANQWRYSTGAAPTQDYVIKWVDAGGSLTPQWAPDDMTIPYEKTITENAQTLFALTNNGNSDVMSLTTTGKGDGLHINLTEDLTGGGHALHLDGAGFEQPALMIHRTTQYGLPEGAATINATINTLDVASAGMTINTNVTDDGNNAYDVEGLQSLLNVTNAVNDVFYTGVWGVGNSDNGIATGVWGDANAVNAQSNFGVIGAAYDAANTNIGVAGVANDANYQGYTTLLPPGFGAGVVAMNAGTTSSDFGVFADVKGDGVGAQAQAINGPALVGVNESDLEPTVVAFNSSFTGNAAPAFVAYNQSDVSPTSEIMNMGDGSALVAMSSTTEGKYTAEVLNFGDGRGLAVTGGKLNDENGGMPFFQDPTDDDDAALVVRNPNAGPGIFATAIKTYGDIWANSSIGASQIIGLNKVIVGDPFGLFIEILPPAGPGAPLVINGDVQINGNLTVTDINANDIVANDIYVNDIVANDLLVNDIIANEITANILNTGILNAALGEFDYLNVYYDANVYGHTELNTLEVLSDASVGGTFDVTGNTTLTTLETSGLAKLNSANVTNNATVGGTLGVTGATTLNNTLTQIGGGQVTFSGNVDANNGLDVMGAANVTGATSLNGTLSQVGGGQVTFSGNVDANNGLDVMGITNLTGAVNQIGGGQVTFSGNVDANNGLDVVGAATVAGPTTLTGTLSQIGGGQVTFSGNVDANNGLDVTGASNLNGATTVTGATSLNGTLSQNGGGQVTFSGNVDANNGLDVVGTTNLTGALNQIGGAQVTISGNVDANNGLDVMGATTLGGTLGVTGAATFANDVNLNGSNLNISNGTRVIAGGVSGADGHLFVSRGPALSPQWTNTIPSLIVTDLEADDVLVNNNAVIDGNLTVNGTDVEINANVTMVGDFDLTGKLTTDDLQVNNNTLILNEFEAVTTLFEITTPLVDVTGALAVSGATTIGGATAINNTLAVSGATTINNTLGVTGNTQLSANLRVDGTSDLRGTIFNTELGGGNEINIIDNTNITGNLTVLGAGLIKAKDLEISLNATINQDLTVDQNATVSQNFTVGGNTSINTLDVRGAVVNPVSAAAPVFVDDNLLVAGNVTINGGVTILGDLTANNLNAVVDVNAGNDVNAVRDVNADRDVNAGRHLDVNNNATIGGNLGVTGNTVLTGTLDAQGAISNSLGMVTVDDDLDVTGQVFATDLLVTNNSQLFDVDVTGTIENSLGNVTVGDNLVVTGISNLQGLATLNNGLTVTAGATSVQGLTATNTQINGTLGVTGLGTFNNGLTVTSGLTNVQALQATTGTFSGAVGAASVATTGAISAGTTLTAGTGITATTGNIVALAGNVSASNDVTAGNLVSAPTGNLTTVNSTTGNITNLNSTTGTITTLNSTTGNIATVNATDVNTTNVTATGTVGTANLTATTGTITNLNSTTGTIATLNSTTGNITTINATTGNITTVNATAGNITTVNATDLNTTNVNASGTVTGNVVNSNTTMTAGTGITATTGNIEALAGQVNAGTSMTAGTSVTAGTALVAGTSVSAITDITTTTGNINAATGNINATTGNINAVAGTVTALNGNFTNSLATNNITINGNLHQGPVLPNPPATNAVFNSNMTVYGTSDFKDGLNVAGSLFVEKDITMNQQLTFAPFTIATVDWDKTIDPINFPLNQVSLIEYVGAANVPDGTPGSVGSILYVWNNNGVGSFDFIGLYTIPDGEVWQFINVDGSKTGWRRLQ